MSFTSVGQQPSQQPPQQAPQGEEFTIEYYSKKEQAVVVRRGRCDSKCGEKTGANGGVYFLYIDLGRSEEFGSLQYRSASSSWKIDGIQHH